VGILYRCLEIRREAITRIPWEISRGDTVLWSSEDAECPPELEWMELLPTQYLADIELMLCLCNQAYMMKERNRAKMLGLKWLAKSTMTPIWDEANGLVGFERRLSATNKKRFEPDDILYIWRRNPEHETEPDVSPAQAALSAANVVYGLDEFVKGYFNRGGVKLTLFGVPESTSTTERDRFNSVLKRMFRGVRSAWSTFVFNADQINPVTIGEGIGELHNDQLMNNRQNALVTTMGVPHSKLFSNAANYATAQQDDMAFYADTLIPDAVLIARQVNRQLLRPLGLAWTFHPEQMNVFQEDEEQRSAALLNYVQAGYPLSVASEMLGLHLPRGMEYSELDPVEPEPVIVLPTPQTPALPPPADNTAEAKAAEIRRFKAWAGKRKHPDPVKFESAILSEDEKAALLAEVGIAANFFESKSGQSTHKDAMPLDPDDPEAEQKERMKIERQAERSIANGLQTQQERVIESLPSTPDDFPRWAREDLENALKRGASEAELMDALRRALIESVDLGVSVAVAQLGGIGFDWTLANDDARRWADQYVGQLIRDIDATTSERVRRSVAAWIENGEPLDALIDELTPIFGRRRAELIASTEVTRAYAEGNRQAYKASGVVQRWEWRTAEDELVCPICGPLAGATVQIDGDFSGFLPDEVRRGTISAPPAHPRCRCWVVPYFPD
jgi:SPP1 gp7 family putative phage head morphogenesis protein